jgi:hypothetical protein
MKGIPDMDVLDMVNKVSCTWQCHEIVYTDILMNSNPCLS